MSCCPSITMLSPKQIFTGENYEQWSCNVTLLLIRHGYHFVLTEKCPPGINNVSSEAHSRWIAANHAVRAYLLASLTEALRAEHEKLETAHEIMESLRKMFNRPCRQDRHIAIIGVMRTRMKSGTSVREHVLGMITHLVEAEINGAVIDQDTKVDIIRTTLSPDFNTYEINYVLNKKQFNFSELLHELEMFESLIGGKNNKKRKFNGSIRGSKKISKRG